MRATNILVIGLTVLTATASAQKKEDFLALQRDIALLQADVTALKRGMEEKVDKLASLVQEISASSRAATATLANLDQQIKQRMTEQQKSLVEPVAGLGVKVDGMTDEFRFVRESITDLNGKVGRISTKLVDLENTIRVLQAPPPPPSGDPGGAASSGGSAAPPAGLSADDLYRSALRDKSGGKLDLAAQQFQDYLKWFDGTEYAPNAQFHLGDIQFSQGNYEAALVSFNLVMEKYPQSSNKGVDAHYMKGKTLTQMGQRTAAAQEYRELIRLYPRHELAAKARSELKALGFTASPPPKKR
jgi:TolA-binding protein